MRLLKLICMNAKYKKGEMHPSANTGKIVEAKDQVMHEPKSSTKREAQSIANLINAGKAKMIRTASKQ